jgi:hypothetical protein
VSGEWRVESGEWRVESGEWSVECGVWSVECGEFAIEWVMMMTVAIAVMISFLTWDDFPIM